MTDATPDAAAIRVADIASTGYEGPTLDGGRRIADELGSLSWEIHRPTAAVATPTDALLQRWQEQPLDLHHTAASDAPTRHGHERPPQLEHPVAWDRVALRPMPVRGPLGAVESQGHEVLGTLAREVRVLNSTVRTAAAAFSVTDGSVEGSTAYLRSGKTSWEGVLREPGHVQRSARPARRSLPVGRSVKPYLTVAEHGVQPVTGLGGSLEQSIREQLASRAADRPLRTGAIPRTARVVEVVQRPSHADDEAREAWSPAGEGLEVVALQAPDLRSQDRRWLVVAVRRGPDAGLDAALGSGKVWGALERIMELGALLLSHLWLLEAVEDQLRRQRHVLQRATDSSESPAERARHAQSAVSAHLAVLRLTEGTWLLDHPQRAGVSPEVGALAARVDQQIGLSSRWEDGLTRQRDLGGVADVIARSREDFTG